MEEIGTYVKHLSGMFYVYVTAILEHKYSTPPSPGLETTHTPDKKFCRIRTSS